MLHICVLIETLRHSSSLLKDDVNEVEQYQQVIS